MSMNESDYVSVGDVCRQRLGQQCQYGSRYLDRGWAQGENSYKFCGDGLRVLGDCSNYHGMKIHKDDVETFVARWEQATGCKRIV